MRRQCQATGRVNIDEMAKVIQGNANFGCPRVGACSNAHKICSWRLCGDSLCPRSTAIELSSRYSVQRKSLVAGLEFLDASSVDGGGDDDDVDGSCGAHHNE